MKIRTKRRILYSLFYLLGIWGIIWVVSEVGIFSVDGFMFSFGVALAAFTSGTWLAEKLGWRRADSANDAFEHWSDKKKEEQGKYGDSLILILTALLAKLAKYDGIVTKNEIQCVDNIFRELGIINDERSALIEIFREAKEGPLTLYDAILIAKHFYAADSQSLRLIMLFLIQLGHSDGAISEPIQEALEDASIALGFEYQEILQAYESSRKEHKGIIDNIMGTSDAAYQVLGCNKDSSIDDIKSRYRELAKTFHPDTIAAKELPLEFMQFATEKFQQIQSAYETIMNARGSS